MTILLVQTFLLLLGAFLLGASFACLIRRGFSGSREAAGAASSLAGAPAGAVTSAETDRFGRALSGGHGPSVPPVFQPGQPVVEVQPRPAPAPASEPVARAPEPHSEPPVAPPQRDVMPPPEPVAAPTPAPAASSQPDPTPSSGHSYTQVAVAAAAAATAVAKAKADAEAAKAKADAEIAVEVGDESDTDGPSRFGTPIVPTPLERTASEPVDDFTRIHAIDVDLKERLVRYGVHRFSQIAAWTPEDVRGASQSLGFQGRIEKENWIEQARILAAGGDPGPAQKREPDVPADTAVPVDGDRLHRIIGVDPQSEALLRANGVTQLAHIAAWTAEDVARIEELLGSAGRVTREGWVEQARFLAGGGFADDPVEETPSEPSDAVAAVSEVEDPAPSAPRSESYAGLRSVRSEALRGEGIAGVATAAVEDLKRIRGIGVLIEKKLNSLGITAYEQVANWTRDDIDRISGLLDFKGRIERENWIEQARILASGGQTEFSRRVDRGDA